MYRSKFNQVAENVYNEKNKKLMKDIEIPNRWKDILFVKDLILLDNYILQIYMFNVIPLKIVMIFDRNRKNEGII